VAAPAARIDGPRKNSYTRSVRSLAVSRSGWGTAASHRARVARTTRGRRRRVVQRARVEEYPGCAPTCGLSGRRGTLLVVRPMLARNAPLTPGLPAMSREQVGVLHCTHPAFPGQGVVSTRMALWRGPCSAPHRVQHPLREQGKACPYLAECVARDTCAARSVGGPGPGPLFSHHSSCRADAPTCHTFHSATMNQVQALFRSIGHQRTCQDSSSMSMKYPQETHQMTRSLERLRPLASADEAGSARGRDTILVRKNGLRQRLWRV
jgi:hypothetical protein